MMKNHLFVCKILAGNLRSGFSLALVHRRELGAKQFLHVTPQRLASVGMRVLPLGTAFAHENPKKCDRSKRGEEREKTKNTNTQHTFNF
jgi:hypothetical protein